LAPDAPGVGAQILTHRIPAMEGATLARGYRAVDCYSRDRHAILGRVDGVEGLYLATAFSGSGFKIAPAVGSCMAELIVDGRAKTVDIDAFSLRRFAEGNRRRARIRTRSGGTTPTVDLSGGSDYFGWTDEEDLMFRRVVTSEKELRDLMGTPSERAI